VSEHEAETDSAPETDSKPQAEPKTLVAPDARPDAKPAPGRLLHRHRHIRWALVDYELLVPYPAPIQTPS
jgi:hypothetical protein